MAETKSSYGKKDGSKKGLNQGGKGRNQTPICRHPGVRKKR